MLPIVITLAGGLGNQLFQLSAGLFIEKKYDREIIYDISNLVKNPLSKPGNYTRKLEIKDLLDGQKIIKSKNLFTIDKLNRRFHRMKNPNSVLIENTDENVLQKVNEQTSAIFGYFQNSSTVLEVWPELASAFKKSSRFQNLLSVEPVERIAVHLRFGDYSDDPKTKSIHGLTKPSYFIDAINKIRTNIDTNLNSIAVITDNSKKAEVLCLEICNGLNYEIYSNENLLLDLEAICKSTHVVISNSTFSWWAGMIAHLNHGATIIYPRPWFAQLSDPELPIYFAKWIAMKRDFDV